MGINLNPFTWWNGATISTMLHTSMKGEHVGTDAQGNAYYRSRRKDSAGRERRWVIYDGANDASRVVAPDRLLRDFDAVLLAGGSETPRDLPIPGRNLSGVHFALEYLIPQNKEVGGGSKNPIDARGKHVVVIGGGDTGADCIGEMALVLAMLW